MKNILNHSAILLLLFLCLMVTGTTLLFIVNVTISKFHLVSFFLLSSVIYYFINKKELDKKTFLKVIGISLIIIVLSTLISTFMFDRSSDGNTYHKLTVGKMADGWNPVYQNVSDFDEQNDVVINTVLFNDIIKQYIKQKQHNKAIKKMA